MDESRFEKALRYELLREQASALGAAGRRLETALHNYARLTTTHRADSSAIEAGLDEIATRVWELALQRELIGFEHNNIDWIAAHFDLPAGIRKRFGVATPQDD
jgi:hypothetical protein